MSIISAIPMGTAPLTGPFTEPTPAAVQVRAQVGPLLLAGLDDGPSAAAHLDRYGRIPRHSVESLAALTTAVGVAGRGGAGFPFGVKLAAAMRGGRHTVIVVNVAEGEPASWKDAALAQLVPHRVLDGACVVASALGVRQIHVVTPRERPGVGAALRRAAGERGSLGGRHEPRFVWHEAEPRFVAGQARAVLELMAGRPNLPVTAWEPEAIRGHRGRPTLLSNAETWAHVGLLARLGVDGYAAHGVGEPGTTLLTHHGTAGVLVKEVPLGLPWSDVLSAAELGRPVLVGGYHGTWVPAGGLAGVSVSRSDMFRAGYALGAGVVLPTPAGDCPVTRTQQLVDYLAAQSAGRCGPCRIGLPALAAAFGQVSSATADAVSRARSTERVLEVAELVERRGACAHPDGTARLVRSLLAAVPNEIDNHLRGTCSVTEPRTLG